MIRLGGVALAALLAGSPVLAECAGTELVSCQVKGSAKWLELCLAGSTLRYSFGPKGAPELVLTRDIGEVVYTPWPGVGRTIWEDVQIRNKGITYAIHTWVERPLDESDPGGSGTGVAVLRGDDPLAEIECAGEQTADFTPLGVELIARGYCRAVDRWKRGSGGWYCE